MLLKARSAMALVGLLLLAVSGCGGSWAGSPPGREPENTPASLLCLLVGEVATAVLAAYGNPVTRTNEAD